MEIINPTNILSQTENKLDVVSRMEILWKNEKLSKTLLEFNEELVSKVISHMEEKEEELKSLNKITKEDADLMELDLQRFKFILKDYFRIRLFKIERYLFYIIANDLTKLLSQSELEFTIELFKMKANYLNEGAKKIPPMLNEFRPLDKTKTIEDRVKQLNSNMITSPPSNSFVIIQVLSREPVTLNMKDIWEESNEVITLNKDDVYCVPLSLVKEYLDEKKIKLI